jgi:ketosteroid isomerase-like protein
MCTPPPVRSGRVEAGRQKREQPASIATRAGRADRVRPRKGLGVSRDNLEVVRRGHEARSAGRIGEWIDTLDPDIEWDISGNPLPDFPVRGAGRDAFVGHVTKYWSLWNDYSQSVERTVEVGDEVVVVLRECARLRNSDAAVEREVATVWTIRNGVRVRFRAFERPEDALKAVGIEE